MNELKLKINAIALAILSVFAFGTFAYGAFKSAHIQMLRQAGETGEANKIVLYFILAILFSFAALLYSLYLDEKLKAAIAGEIEIKEHTELLEEHF